MDSSYSVPSTPNPTPLSARAQEYHEKSYKPRLAALQRQIAETPLTILVWGPDPSNEELYAKRTQIRDELRRRGHDAHISEELVDSRPPSYSEKAFEFLQAIAADLVVVLEASFGSVAEVHDFSDYRIVNWKMLIFVSDQAQDGYSYQGALTELRKLYNNVETFHPPEDLASCNLRRRVLEKVDLFQLVKWRATVNARSWGLIIDETA